MINGYFNEKLVPIVSIALTTEEGERKQLDFPIDTGFDEHLQLNAELVTEHKLWQRPVNDGGGSSARLRTFGGIEISPRRMLQLRWGHGVRRVPALLNLDNAFRDFHGLIGMGLLTSYRAVFDVTVGGAFSIDRIPSIPRHRKALRLPWRHQPEGLCMDALNWEMACSFRILPWIKIEVRDSGGTWQLLKFNVDTGFNGELSIPVDLLGKLGLTLPTRACLHSGIPECVDTLVQSTNDRT